MENTVLFRDFEEKDIEFIFKCKNDEKLNNFIVGEWHPFSHEEAAKWVRGCMGEHDTYKFWAICTNTEEQKIIGWVSISQIDMENKCACFHGIVIADSGYRDGIAEIESYLFIYKYCFETLKLNRVYGSCLTCQKESMLMGKAFYCTQERLDTGVVVKNGVAYDLSTGALYRNIYETHKLAGDYELYAVIRRIVKMYKSTKNSL